MAAYCSIGAPCSLCLLTQAAHVLSAPLPAVCGPCAALVLPCFSTLRLLMLLMSLPAPRSLWWAWGRRWRQRTLRRACGSGES